MIDISDLFKYSGFSKKPYSVIFNKGDNSRIYPLINDCKGVECAYIPGPEHGRSFVVGMCNDRFIISKGNGLSYTSYPFIDTRELGVDIWGLLLESDARRDFIIGNEVRNLGIKTNNMQYVLRIEDSIGLSDSNGDDIKPILLQYDVECPYRISDIGFMSKRHLQNELNKWKHLNRNNREYEYLIAADVLVNNLRILHDNNILHNAITTQNYTWALELLDFELASSPSYPYSNTDWERHKCQLYDREIIHTYQVIVYIARVLQQEPDYKLIDDIFKSNEFDISKYSLIPVTQRMLRH